MAKPKPDIFQEFQERHFRRALNFKPANIQVVETEGIECDKPCTRSFILKPDELERWLEKDLAGVIDDNGQQRHRLRIILGYLEKGAKFEYMMHGQEIASGEMNPSFLTLPFSQKHYQLMCQRLRLPAITTLLLSRGSRPLRGHFQVTRMPSEDTKPLYGMTLSSFSSLLIGFKVGVSMSFCPSSGSTAAVVLGSGVPDGFAWLQQDLEQLAALTDNPFLVPVLICQRLTEAIYTSIDDNFERLHHVEIGSGQTGIMMFGENGKPVPRGNCEDPNLSIAVLGVAQRALAVEAYIRGHLLTVRSVKSELLAFPWQQFTSEGHDHILEKNELIVKQLDFISRTLDFALIRVNHLKQRANVQTTAITNLLAQRNNEANHKLAESSTSIAHDTRRDSSAMKSIAILTMVFLPATFTATYFSTPAVVALEPSQSLYWSVTVPLTLVVLLVWLFTLYYWVVAKLLPLRGGNNARFVGRLWG